MTLVVREVDETQTDQQPARTDGSETMNPSM
jgi:hypothetical protein